MYAHIVHVYISIASTYYVRVRSRALQVAFSRIIICVLTIYGHPWYFATSFAGSCETNWSIPTSGAGLYRWARAKPNTSVFFGFYVCKIVACNWTAPSTLKANCNNISIFQTAHFNTALKSLVLVIVFRRMFEMSTACAAGFAAPTR